MREIKYDGMPRQEEVEPANGELNEDEMVGYIMRNTKDHTLDYEQVKAVLDAETAFLTEKGFIDPE